MDGDRIKQLEQLLRSNRLDQRKMALDELVSYPMSVAVPIFKQLSTEADFRLRCIAVMGLANHRTEESFAVLKRCLETEQDSSVLAEAANSIFEFGDRAIAPLQQLFDRCDHWLVRQTVVSILVESDQPDVLLAIAKKAINDPTQTTKETGILALHRLINTPFKQDAFELFTDLANSSDWRTRWRTAIALTAIQDEPAKQLLIKLQQDEHYRVVAAAFDALNS